MFPFNMPSTDGLLAPSVETEQPSQLIPASQKTCTTPSVQPVPAIELPRPPPEEL
jgi:hypothetical protein